MKHLWKIKVLRKSDKVTWNFKGIAQVYILWKEQIKYVIPYNIVYITSFLHNKMIIINHYLGKKKPKFIKFRIYSFDVSMNVMFYVLQTFCFKKKTKFGKKITLTFILPSWHLICISLLWPETFSRYTLH